MQPLVDAVLAAPDDDGARVAYAAWCDGQSDEPTRARGAFIRVQVDLARLSAADVAAGKAYRPMLLAMKLLDQHRRAWVAPPLAALADHVEFDRGFVEQVTTTARAFLANAPALFAAAPIRHLDLTGVAGAAADLAASFHLARIRSLRLDRAGLDDGDVRLLAQSPHLAELRWLSLEENGIGLDGAEALATSKHLPRLRYVTLAGNPVDPCEQLGVDGDVVVATHMPEAGKLLERRHGRIAWLHRDCARPGDCHPSRFRV